METATQSKNARRIESILLNKLALIGQNVFAQKFGVAEYTVSRMKLKFFRQMSMALDILEYGIEDKQMAELAKMLVEMMEKEKAPKNREFLEA